MYTTSRPFSVKLHPMDQLLPYRKNMPRHSPSPRANRIASFPSLPFLRILRILRLKIPILGLRFSLFKLVWSDAKLQLTTPNDSKLDLTAPISKILPRFQIIEILDFLFVSCFGFRASNFLPRKGKTSQNKVRPGKYFRASNFVLRFFLPIPYPLPT